MDDSDETDVDDIIAQMKQHNADLAAMVNAFSGDVPPENNPTSHRNRFDGPTFEDLMKPGDN